MCSVGGAVVSVLVCKVIKKVSYLQSLFVVISRLLAPFASATRLDCVRRPIGFRSPSDAQLQQYIVQKPTTTPR